jgi:hypothetical protein
MGFATKTFPGEAQNPIEQLKSTLLYVPDGDYNNWPDNLIGADVPWTANAQTFKDKGNVLGVKAESNATAAAPKNKLTPNQSMALGGVSAVSNMVGELSQAKKNLATDEYLNDVNYWKEQGKMWFDKNSDYAPTFEEYAGNMPSAVDALKEGSITGSNTADSAIGGATSGAIAGTAIAPGVGTAIGAVAGGVIGIIEGVMAEGAAEKRDSKEKERAYQEYKNKLKLWTFQKNAKNEEDRIVKQKAVDAENKNLRAIGTRKKEDIAQRNEARRSELVSILKNVGALKNNAIQEKINRWN